MASSPLGRFRVAVLPDVFVDAIASVPPWPVASKQWAAVVRRGGGNVAVPPIEFKLGGNAANSAFALARLGAHVDLIARTSPLGRFLLGSAPAEGRLNLDRVRTAAVPSATLALEMGPANLMLSHAGPLRSFGPRDLQAADWRVLESADAVLATNWAQNRLGTALWSALAQRLARRGVPLFVDTSDPHMAAKRVPGLLKSGLWKGVRSFALNENELRAFAGSRGSAEAQARRLAERLGCALDVHTREWAMHFAAGEVVRMSARRTRPRRLTGAGDAWNAGNVAGYLLDLPPARRLGLAHEVASAYVTGRSGLPPLGQEVASLRARP